MLKIEKTEVLGLEHIDRGRNFMRMITVYVDITAPLYWWKEYYTHDVGNESVFYSITNKIHKKEFTLDDFSHEHIMAFDTAYDNGCCTEDDDGFLSSPHYILIETIRMLNKCREIYLEAFKAEYKTGLSAKNILRQMIQILPISYNQKQTVMLNYEVLANIYKSQKNSKLDEWRVFCCWIKSLPHFELITGEFDETKSSKTIETWSDAVNECNISADIHAFLKGENQNE